MEAFNGNTIAEAKEFLRNNWKKGVPCPCCTQFVKLYKRKLNSGMAWTLVKIYIETKSTISDTHPLSAQHLSWIPVKEFLRVNKYHNGHDWTLLQHWGLLEERKTDEGLPSSGRWRITESGKAFVDMKLMVPKHISFFNSKEWERSDELINIKQALGDKFNYDELMKND